MKKIHMAIVAMIASSLFLIAAIPIQAADVTIQDPVGDVSKIDIYEQSSLVTYSPDINIDNIDLTRLTYTKTGGSTTLTLEVKGNIENRGSIADVTGNYPENMTEMKINYIHYELVLGTKLAGSPGETYTVDYVNRQCQLTTLENDTINLTSSQFSTAGNKLTVTIPLSNADEIYDYLNATTTFFKFNLSGDYQNITNPDEFGSLYTLLTDVAPNPALAVNSVDAPNVGSVGESIQFNSSVVPLTGLPPYSYEWHFGDGATSTKQNPTHAYSKAGTFTYNLTVTDQSNAKAYDSASIMITGQGGGGGATSSPLLLFLAVIIVIAAIGIVVLIVIIRRR
jgi:PKD repeat protein